MNKSLNEAGHIMLILVTYALNIVVALKKIKYIMYIMYMYAYNQIVRRFYMYFKKSVRVRGVYIFLKKTKKNKRIIVITQKNIREQI